MLLEFKLIMIRRNHQVKLNKENRKAFKKIKDYMYNSSLVFFEKEEVLQQILDIMLQAQNEDKSINLFLGHDHKKFCDSVISEYSTTKSFVLRVIGFIDRFIIFAFLGMLLDMINYKAPVFKLNTVITMVFLLFITEPFSRKSRKEDIYPTYKYLPIKRSLPANKNSFILAIPFSFITTKVLSLLNKKYGLDLLNYKFKLYSIRYLIVFAILFICISEIYKSVCNKQRMS